MLIDSRDDLSLFSSALPWESVPVEFGFDPPREAGGGGKGIRTPDLLIANEMLYQLSYTPSTN